MVRSALARWGITHQVFKSALAASASWAVAAHMLDHKFPVFAPMAALLTIQVNLFGSWRAGIQRVLAIIVGVGIAMLAFHFTGANWWIIFLVVLATLMLGTRMQLGIAGINQVPLTALLILAVKASVPTYAVDRILNTLLGTAIAVLVNTVLWPPDTLPQAAEAVSRLSRHTGDLLRRAADVLADTASPADAAAGLAHGGRALGREVGDALRTVEGAKEGLKLNPSARRLGPVAERYAGLAATLERVAVQTRGIARSVSELQGEAAGNLPDAQLLADLLARAATQVESTTDACKDQSVAARSQAHDARQACERLYRRVAAQARTALMAEGADPGVWPRYGSILADVGHLSEELADRLAGSTDTSGPPPPNPPGKPSRQVVAQIGR